MLSCALGAALLPERAPVSPPSPLDSVMPGFTSDENSASTATARRALISGYIKHITGSSVVANRVVANRSVAGYRKAICDGIDLWRARVIECGLLLLLIHLVAMTTNAEVQEFC
jgi:hypothetical protein